MPAIILLAAGSSSRLGEPKQLVPFRGQTLLRRAAETAVAAAAGAPVVVVTGALHQQLLPELAGLPVHSVRCAQWERGMGASLKTGLQQLGQLISSPTDVIILLCDQPFVTPELLLQLETTHQQTDQPIVACTYADTRGVPVFFAAAMMPALLALPDGSGAGYLLKQHAAQVMEVSFPAGVLDVDTPEQVAALRALE
ncbi:nucleotidyltransferase family protein [Hymenobacter rigui]|uniref:Nucleotidyltransferase family protein n=1 Tax=Hymenobacter rigui TaxID=334424 RepID=A0A428KEW5_9BACT|nr:nucleotidyltransferase family protein [Hymenobacter rigui]RSK44963.1 nucleotidyltransferase family protein [Hymenobacter rigui]